METNVHSRGQRYNFNALIVDLAKHLKKRSTLENITAGYMFAGFGYKHAVHEYKNFSDNLEICWIDIIEEIVTKSHVNIAENQIMELLNICKLEYQPPCKELRALMDSLWKKKFSTDHFVSSVDPIPRYLK